MMRCLAPDCQMAGLGCDNMTVVLVTLLHGTDYLTLSKKCSTPRQNLNITTVEQATEALPDSPPDTDSAESET